MLFKSIGFFISVLAMAALACGLSIGSAERSDDRPPRQEEAARPADAGAGGSDPATTEDDGQAEEGAKLFNRMGCSGCHTAAGQPGPNLEGVFGSQVRLEGGQTVTADEDYLRRSILEPKAELVDGYQPIMPEYGDQLNEAQLAALAAYIRSLQD